MPTICCGWSGDVETQTHLPLSLPRIFGILWIQHDIQHPRKMFWTCLNRQESSHHLRAYISIFFRASIQYLLERTEKALAITGVLMANHGWVEFPLTNTENQTWFDVKFTMYFDDFHHKITRTPPFINRMLNDWSNKTSIYTGFSMAIVDEWLPDVGPCRRLPAIARSLFVQPRSHPADCNST